jgi:hypothetical protein
MPELLQRAGCRLLMNVPWIQELVSSNLDHRLHNGTVKFFIISLRPWMKMLRFIQTPSSDIISYPAVTMIYHFFEAI